MRIAASDYNNASQMKVFESVAGEVIDAIDRLAVALRRCGEGYESRLSGLTGNKI